MDALVAGVVLLHLGKLHPFEHVLVWVLAFGPFVLLAFAVRTARRRDLAEEQAEQQAGTDAEAQARQHGREA